jgi:hypothetical protein
MELQRIETPAEVGDKRQPEQQRRFRLVKLEERIAPGQIGTASISPPPRSHPCRRCTSGGTSIV